MHIIAETHTTGERMGHRPSYTVNNLYSPKFLGIEIPRELGKTHVSVDVLTGKVERLKGNRLKALKNENGSLALDALSGKTGSRCMIGTS